MTRANVRGYVIALLFGLPSALSAQAEVAFFGGATLPLGDFGEVAETGFFGSALATLHPGGSRLGGAFKASYARAPHTVDGDRSEVAGVSALANFPLLRGADAEVSALWGGGVLWHGRRSDSFSGLDATRVGVAIEAGLTASRAVGGVRLFAVATYTRGLGDIGSANFPTEMISLGGGVGFRPGSSGR